MYNDFYTSQNDRYISRTLDQVLTTTGSVVAYDVTNGKYGIRSVDGLANGAVTNGSWSVVMQSSNDSLTVYGIDADYDPRTISVGDAGIITVVYSADADGDGLPDRMESALG
ncbi:MAG TPA: hypothetical protein VHP36_08925 [Chitinispirillaceae bacterium]|nr:hypothetical protein [Chitinispirillaceae bacterium]